MGHLLDLHSLADAYRLRHVKSRHCIIYLQMNDKANAVPHLKKALNIYAEIYEDEPELTQRKIYELQDAVSSYGINAQNLISEN